MTSEYTIAVHALVFLNHKKGIMSSEDVAENVCTNPARIRKVLSRLKKAGLVETKEGTEGGYLFTKDPQTVTLKAVGDALETTFVSSSWRTGDAHMECLIASGMEGIMEGIYEELNRVCQERLRQITVADIDKQIFGRPAANDRCV